MIVAIYASTFTPYPGTTYKVEDCIDACAEDKPNCCSYTGATSPHGKTNSSFVDFDLIDTIVGVSPCHPQSRNGVAVLTQTYPSQKYFFHQDRELRL